MNAVPLRWRDFRVHSSEPRDPDRILPLLAQLLFLWMEHPDQRLGQLITNLSGPDVTFYIEDEDLWENIRQVMISGKWPTT